jgi:hypothetical protein
VLNNPEDIRPPVVIYHVIKYLRDCIVDQDRCPAGQSYFKYCLPEQTRHSFLDVYSFTHDRIR